MRRPRPSWRRARRRPWAGSDRRRRPCRAGTAAGPGPRRLLGLGFGLLVDHIGSAQRINLLAPPVWAVIAWNLVVYAAAVAAAAAARRCCAARWPAWASRWRARALAQRRQPRRGGPGLRRRLGRGQRAAAGRAHRADAAPGRRGAGAGRCWPACTCAAWCSTTASAGKAPSSMPAQVHALLSVLLAPALALSGQTLPDVAALQALRAPQPGASAAPWIHLYALQLVLLVVLPRLLLALWARAARAPAAGRTCRCRWPSPTSSSCCASSTAARRRCACGRMRTRPTPRRRRRCARCARASSATRRRCSWRPPSPTAARSRRAICPATARGASRCSTWAPRPSPKARAGCCRRWARR